MVLILPAIQEKLTTQELVEFNIFHEAFEIYDVINEIFFKEKPGNLALIKKLYDDLNDLLADNPQFHHQKAKCYLWHSAYAEDKIGEINNALRFAKVARHNLMLQSNVNNEKIMISLAHIDFTIALIYAKKCTLECYGQENTFKEALHMIHRALISPYNSEYCRNLMKRREKKINDIRGFLVYIQTGDISSHHLSRNDMDAVNELIMKGYNLKI